MHSIIVKSMSGCLVVSSRAQDWNRQIWSTEGRLGNQYMTRRRSRKRRQYFADSLGKCRSLFECSKECRHRVSLHVLSDLRRRDQGQRVGSLRHARSGIGTSTRHTGGSGGIRLSSVIDTSFGNSNSSISILRFCRARLFFVDGKKMEIFVVRLMSGVFVL